MIYYEKKSKKTIGFLIICLFLLVIIYILVSLINKIDYNISMFSNNQIEEVTSFSSNNEISVEELIENSMYSIVGVSKIKEKTLSSFSNNSENILGMGSGVVISKDGYILANSSVTGGINSICYITLLNGAVHTGKVVWEDNNLDIAIVETDAISLPSVSFASKSELGEKIYLLSNYTGGEIQKSVEEGIISQKDITFKMFNGEKEIYVEDVIKININLNKNNTGGAVINSSGEIVGIASKQNESIIPLSRIENVLKRLIEKGFCEKIDLGIYGYDNNVIRYIDNNLEIENGIYVENVDGNGLLNGLIKSGEIITRIDGIKVMKMSDIKEYVYKKNEGETLIISVIRENVEKNIEVVI